MKRFISYISCLLILAACQEKQPLPQENQEPVLTRISINLSTDDAFSKANLPLYPDQENLIHDVWVIQFSERGVLYTGVDKFYRTDDQEGARFLTLEAEVMSGKSTICLLANLNKINTESNTFFDTEALQQSLPDNLPQFKNTFLDMNKFLHFVNTNSKLAAVPMFGYWEGTIGSGTPELGSGSLNVTMGRMLCRINLSIYNKTSQTLTKLRFSNAASKTYYFPQINSEALPAEAYCSIEGALSHNLTLNAGHNATIYFYWSPNFCYGEENATKVTFYSGDNRDQEVCSCVVTTSLLTDENPDYNLYHNCNYSITVTIE